ncbi:MAG: COQ9 family protein [Planktomarina sp.]|uniref:COQ9 family protein n=1 Tax=Planktomarina sp. TaxID=2024851 RepID=UPI00288E7D9F|nr:COQ9 family protein [Planktomarina sp.]MDG1295388.1 COQ9 family protein [Planktomarina sp.]MDT2030928.1 COQ9 family protein [Planktomarina sp.]MDT2071349.1 COQ9 family protein [Planktomarina sp.]
MKVEQHLSELLTAIVPHVVFDGWSKTSFDCAVADLKMDPAFAAMLAPRGALDLAVAYHRQGDAHMRAAYQSSSNISLKIREKIILAVRLRLETIADKEAVRRATSLFALPQYAGEGAKLIWGTADHIWDVLGDSSRDVNWYSKRATLSAVYGATVLFWLGDESSGHAATWAFLDRRIENVMQIEIAKAKIRDNKPLNSALAGPLWLLGKIKAPQTRDDLPGRAPKF